MRLRRLEVSRFRGILALDWRHIGSVAALVGPGDSGKTTVLDAIDRVTTPRWAVPFDDSDFWNLDTTQPILIRCTLTDFPDELYRDTRLGLSLRTFDPTNGTCGPADDNDERSPALVIELRVDASLEPTWSVVDSSEQRQRLSSADREALSVFRVGSVVDGHLSWSRGSLLSRITTKGDPVGEVLAEAARTARSSFSSEPLGSLNAAAAATERGAKRLGVASTTRFTPALDPGAMGYTNGAMCLHVGPVPLRRSGLGTRRLVAIAMQTDAGGQPGMLLADEIEHGLEPHRIRRLLRALRESSTATTGVSQCQLVVTTHSPSVLVELDQDDICVTRRTSDGAASIASLPNVVAQVLKRAPAALLARRVVVTEGATEEGLCHALDRAWTKERNDESFAYRGVAVVDGGGGTQPASLSGALSSLGYDVAVLLDSDGKSKIGKAGSARVFMWPGGVCLEQQLAADLPLDALRQMCLLATQSSKAGGFRSVRDSLAAALSVDRSALTDEPQSWPDVGEEHEFRKVLGAVAHNKEWFKTRPLGFELGNLVVAHWAALGGKSTRSVLEGLRDFVYAD